MDFPFAALATALSVGSTIWLLFKARESNFKPYFASRIPLFISGFAMGYSGLWLLSGSSFLEHFWFKMGLSTLIGFGWAIRATGVLEATSAQQEEE